MWRGVLHILVGRIGTILVAASLRQNVIVALISVTTALPIILPLRCLQTSHRT